MFGLPLLTLAIIVAGAGFWNIFTGVFLMVSRRWHLSDEQSTPTESGGEEHQ